MNFICDINKVVLIDAIKRNECIWNSRLQEYKNKSLRSQAWAEVCKEFISDYEHRSSDEQHAIKVHMQTKWRKIRDGFTRYCRILKINSGSPISPKKYAYYDQLQFLKDLTEEQQGHSSYLQISPSIDIRVSEEVPRSRKRLSPGNYPSESTDDDKMFFMSLVNDFKKIAYIYKVDLKSKILSLMNAYSAISSLLDTSTFPVACKCNPGNNTEPESSRQELFQIPNLEFGSDVE